MRKQSIVFSALATTYYTRKYYIVHVSPLYVSIEFCINMIKKLSSCSVLLSVGKKLFLKEVYTTDDI